MSDKAIARANKLLATVAVFCVIFPVCQILLSFLPVTRPAILTCAAILFAAGYGMQTLYGAVMSRTVDIRLGYRDESGYEGSVSAFNALHAALPIIITVVMTYISVGIFDSILYRMYMSGKIPYYDPDSLFPYLGAAAVFILLLAGIIIWFYPPVRVISLKTILAYMVVMGLTFIFEGLGQIDTSTSSICLVFFVISSMIVLNQSNIYRKITDSISAVSLSARYDNLLFVILTLIAILLALFFFATIFEGLSFIFRFIFLFITIKMLGKSGDDTGVDYKDPEVINEVFVRELFEGKRASSKFLIVFFFIALAFFLYMLITNNKESTKRFVAWIRKLIESIMMFFMNIRSYSIKQQHIPVFVNFTDEEIKLQDAVIRPYEKSGLEKRSYRDFEAQLNALPTDEKRLQFAYITLLSVYRSLKFSLRNSDTPREVRDKIIAQSSLSIATMQEITDVIEMVDYIERLPEKEKYTSALQKMCQIIKQHYAA